MSKVYVVKCAECKDCDLCVNLATVDAASCATEKRGVDFTHVYFCNSCLHAPPHFQNGVSKKPIYPNAAAHLYAWGHREGRKDGKANKKPVKGAKCEQLPLSVKKSAG